MTLEEVYASLSEAAKVIDPKMGSEFLAQCWLSYHGQLFAIHASIRESRNGEPVDMQKDKDWVAAPKTENLVQELHGWSELIAKNLPPVKIESRPAARNQT